MAPRRKDEPPKVLSTVGPASFLPNGESSSPGGSGGPTVRMVSSERAMKPYTIFETEILAISRASALSSIAFSFAAGLGGYALKLYYEPTGATPNDSALVATTILAAVCAAAGIWANNWRHEVIRQIRKESGDPQKAASWNSKLQFWKQCT